MKPLLTIAFAGLLPVLSYAQSLNINLDQIAAKAMEKAEINLDEGMLKAALPVAGMSKKLGDVASKLDGLKNLTVRHYEFATANLFSENDLASLRQQVSTDKAWLNIVNMKDKNDNVQIFLKKDEAGKLTEFLVIATEPKELTVVHISGSLDLAQLQEIVTSKIAFGGTAAGNQ